MATETKQIILRKGTGIPTALAEAELGFATDTKTLFVGTGVGSVKTLEEKGHKHTKANITDFAHQHDATDVVQTSTARFVTDTEKARWNNKSNVLVAGENITLTPSGDTVIVSAAVLQGADGADGLDGDGISEWIFYKKLSTGNGVEDFLVNETALGEAFDFDNFDYKFVYDGQTTIEGNSSPYIRFNNDSQEGRHAFTYDRTIQSQEGAPIQTLQGSMDTTDIPTGVMLGTATSDIVGVTLLTIEFIVTKARVASEPYTLLNYHLEGRGTATAGNGNTVPATSSLIAIGRSSFSGNYEMAGIGSPVHSIYFWHGITDGITDGATDINVLRIYRRHK